MKADRGAPWPRGLSEMWSVPPSMSFFWLKEENVTGILLLVSGSDKSTLDSLAVHLSIMPKAGDGRKWKSIGYERIKNRPQSCV